jgi:hypothetical protein
MESDSGIGRTVIAGLAIGVLVLIVLSLMSYSSTSGSKYPTLIEAIRYDMSEIAINKATITTRTESEYGITTGPPLCIAKFTQLEIKSDMQQLDIILTDADKNNGDEVMHRLTPDEFIALSERLCVNEHLIPRNEGREIHRYNGRISIDDDAKKYWYSINVYWNWTAQSEFKQIDKNFDGILPEVDQLKVYIFASSEDYFEPDLLDEIRTNIVDFEVTDESNFKFKPSIQGIVNSDAYLVIPSGVDVYIDSAFVKADGSLVTVQDFPQPKEFLNGFHQGQLGVYYDYEYMGTPAIWFTVDSGLYAEKIDSRVDKIRALIEDHISQCQGFRKTLTPHEEDAPCP